VAGWIKLYRCFDCSEAAHFPPCTRELWFYLLRNVNHANNGKFKRGSGFFAFDDIQEALSWTVGFRVEKYSKPQLTKAIRRLKNALMIETTRATRGLHVTVLNYNKYQMQQDDEGNDEGNGISLRRKHEGNLLKQEERNKEKNMRKSAGESTEFDEFWKAYPRKKSKVDAQKTWKQVKGDSIFSEIMAGLKRATTSPDWTKNSGQYIPYPATWLRAGGWMDEAGNTAQKTCQTCRHHGDQCQGKNETCSAYEVEA